MMDTKLAETGPVPDMTEAEALAATSDEKQQESDTISEESKEESQDPLLDDEIIIRK
jgi:hypothetical protein